MFLLFFSLSLIMWLFLSASMTFSFTSVLKCQNMVWHLKENFWFNYCNMNNFSCDSKEKKKGKTNKGRHSVLLWESWESFCVSFQNLLDKLQGFTVFPLRVWVDTQACLKSLNVRSKMKHHQQKWISPQNKIKHRIKVFFFVCLFVYWLIGLGLFWFKVSQDKKKINKSKCFSDSLSPLLLLFFIENKTWMGCSRASASRNEQYVLH